MKSLSYVITVIAFLFSTWAQACGEVCCQAHSMSHQVENVATSKGIGYQDEHSASKEKDCHQSDKSSSNSQSSCACTHHARVQGLTSESLLKQKSATRESHRPDSSACYHSADASDELLAPLEHSLSNDTGSSVLSANESWIQFYPLKEAFASVSLRGPPQSQAPLYILFESYLI